MSTLLNQKVRAPGVLRAVPIVPWTISAVIAAFSFKFIFDYNFGILNYLFDRIGLQPVDWLSESKYGGMVNGNCEYVVWYTVHYVIFDCRYILNKSNYIRGSR